MSKARSVPTSATSGTVPDRFTTVQERTPDGRWRVQHDAAEPADADSLLEAYVAALRNLARASTAPDAKSKRRGAR
ncbi:hypothetical protein [Myxococcus faecalis]|uniref:hypothetical protein n=1 Tax=Myxococcus faecalis TaxID=3115646 RepID=UPI003CE92B40